jgi:predicted phosphodiesterase
VRVVVLADVHGNLAALEAALEEVERQSPDQIVVAGDVINGAPDSSACWEMVKSLRCPIVRGNHERYVFDFDSERAEPEWSTPQFGIVQTSVSQLNCEQRQELANLALDWSHPHIPDLIVVHASLRKDSDAIRPYTPEPVLKTMFPRESLPSIIVRGHDHHCGIRAWQGRQVVTTGSVGLPLDGNPAAQFVSLERRRGEWAVQHHAVPYDLEATLRRFEETDHVGRSGPMGRLLLREIATAAHHITPFLNFYRKLEGVSLDEAVSRFLEM